MRKTGATQRPGWVLREAAKHITPESIRKRIQYERDQIRVLEDVGLTEGMAQSLEAHHELIQVLSERLARAGS
jgi:hypothetical protein